jgi:ATP-binding cassette subfamily B protein RaxB
MMPGSDGVSLRTLTETGGRYGVRLEAWKFRRDAIDSVRTPAILWIDGDHFVVLDSVTAEGVFVRDPAKGRLQWTRERLHGRWNGTAAVAVRTP